MGPEKVDWHVSAGFSVKEDPVVMGTDKTAFHQWALYKDHAAPAACQPYARIKGGAKQLEASLRMLSLSTALPPPATEDQDQSEATRGAFSQRPCRPRPHSLPPALPEEETRRIARIFSSQYSKTH
ncbi:C2 domain-containing protein 3 [Fukomys damarensis]|uniref:C2 domain-containing protein 3 n=1 Tax=Fukomys damarensis TaxID=885580 RepID=A0A091DMJ2_FUKDA|nr:C2 domain-containing protein 3 [Fukomys damarensis]